MKTEYLEEGMWVYMLHSRGSTSKTIFLFAKLERRNGKKPFSVQNSCVWIPDYGVDVLREEDILFIFPKVRFRPIHILIDKIAMEDSS